MSRRSTAAALAGLLVLTTVLPAAPPAHPALDRGLALLREGDFEAAVIELDAAVRRLEADPSASAHAPWAYVHLGVAYLELEQEAVARGKFQAALARDPTLRLDPAAFSAQQVRVFESVRAEMPAPPAPARPTRPAATASPAAEKKGNRALVYVLGGGAAVAGAAVALAGGGSGAGAEPTTTTTAPVGGGPSTTAPPASPPPTEPPSTAPSEPPGTTPPTTNPGSPPTTNPGPPPTTTPPTTVPSPPPTTAPTPPPTTLPSPPPTTLPAPCRYDVTGSVSVPLTGCINCTCSVSADPASCAWNAQASDPQMIQITVGQGTGNGNVVFNVSPSLAPRTGRITLAQGGGTCVVSQAVLVSPPRAKGWLSFLDLEGGTGQITADSARVAYPSAAPAPFVADGRRIEAIVVTAKGRPGTWRFRMPAPGPIRVIAGEVAALGPDSVTFRLAGRPGERIVFARD